MKNLGFILIILSIALSSCSIDWNEEKDKKIIELEDKINKINTQLQEDNKIITPEYSFRTHIIQFGGMHSKIYDGVYWELGRGSDSPQSDSKVSDLPKGLINIDYRGRKDYFTIACPDNFTIEKCSINGANAILNKNSCSFYFPETASNSDISFNCINEKFLPDL